MSDQYRVTGACVMLKKAGRYLFITAVISACLIPSVGMIIFGESQPAANEILAQRPALTDDNGKLNKNITEDITDYMADRSAFRQQFITAYARLQTFAFGESVSDKVLLGKSDGTDRWLYYSKTEDDWLHRGVMSDMQVNNIAHTLALMQEYAASQGTKLVFTVAPNKNSVYPQYMPYTGEKSDGLKNLDKLVPALENAGVNYADLASALNEMSDSGGGQPIYHRLDSHWTALGAAVGYEAVSDALGIRHHDWLDEKYDYEKVHKGDLYEMLYPAGKELDIDAVFDKKFDFGYLQESVNDAGETVYEPSGAVYGDADAPPYDSIRIDTYKYTDDAASGENNTDERYSLLMFRDSFGNALYPFMADTFERATFSRQMPYRIDWLQGGDYTHCVVEIVERNISDLSFKAPVMPALQRAASDASGGDVVSGDDIRVSYDDPCDIAGYVKVSGIIDKKLIGKYVNGYRVLIKSGDVYYEASPAGADDDGRYAEGAFTAYIPAEAAGGGDMSFILACQMTL